MFFNFFQLWLWVGLDNVFYTKKQIVLDNVCINTSHKGNYFISWFNVVSLGTPLDDQPKEPEVSNTEALSAEKDMSLPGKILQTIDWNHTLMSERC